MFAKLSLKRSGTLALLGPSTCLHEVPKKSLCRHLDFFHELTSTREYWKYSQVLSGISTALGKFHVASSLHYKLGFFFMTSGSD